MTRAQSQLVLTSAARRRVFGEYQSTEPSRFLDEIPAELVERIAPAYASSYQGTFNHGHYEFRTNPYGRKGKSPRLREAETELHVRGGRPVRRRNLRSGHARAACAVRRRHRRRRLKSTTTT